MPLQRRLALLGGSFDPIHEGHLFIARCAREAFGLDRVVLVPAARPPHKPGVRLAPGEDRLAMAELAARGEDWLSASGLELKREGPSYTYDTLLELTQGQGKAGEVEPWFVIGSDNLAGLPGWYRVTELLELARPIVVWRGGADQPGIPSDVRERLGPRLSQRLLEGFLDVPPHPASATGLRAALGRGEGVPDHLPAPVADYIRVRGLYTSP